jgi:hypothetical protein
MGSPAFRHADMLSLWSTRRMMEKGRPAVTAAWMIPAMSASLLLAGGKGTVTEAEWRSLSP